MKTLSRGIALVAPIAMLVAVAAPGSAAGTNDPYPDDQPGDKSYVSNTNVLERYMPDGTGNNESYKVVAPRAQANAMFTANPIVVDGVPDAAWDSATAYPIEHKFNTSLTGSAPDATAHGTLRLMWDGPVLYGLVEVSGYTTQSDAGTPNWNSATFTPNTDGLFVNMDVFNDQWGLEPTPKACSTLARTLPLRRRHRSTMRASRRLDPSSIRRCRTTLHA